MESIFSLKSRIGVLKRIPKSARPLAAKTYVDLINKCIAINDLSSWENLLTFSYKVFHISPENKTKKRSLASIVKENLSKITLPTDEQSFQTTSVRVKDSIMSFSFGTASGMDGFRPQFFKDLISTSAGNFGNSALTAITDLCNGLCDLCTKQNN